MIGETCASEQLVVERLEELQRLVARPLQRRRDRRQLAGGGHDSSGEGGIRVVPRTPSMMKPTSSM